MTGTSSSFFHVQVRQLGLHHEPWVRKTNAHTSNHPTTLLHAPEHAKTASPGRPSSVFADRAARPDHKKPDATGTWQGTGHRNYLHPTSHYISATHMTCIAPPPCLKKRLPSGTKEGAATHLQSKGCNPGFSLYWWKFYLETPS